MRMRQSIRSSQGIRRVLIGAWATMALTATGCNDAQTGALLGAGAGAIGGAVIGHQSGHAGEGAAIGAGVGGVTGYIIGNESDKSKQQRYYSDRVY